MWVDMVLARVDRDKIDGKPNAYLLEFWQQLKVDQRFTPLKKKQGEKGGEKAMRPEAEWPTSRITQYSGTPTLPLSPSSISNREKAEERAYRGGAGNRGRMWSW